MHKNSRGIVPILIIILVVALVGGVGFFVYQSSKSGQKAPQIQEITSPAPQKTMPPSPSPTTGPMSKWKTFQSSTYKVSYPPNLDVNELDANALALSKWGPTQKADTEFYDGVSLSFTPQEIPNTTLQGFVQTKVDEINDVGISTILSGPDPITINSYKGLRYTEQGLGIFKTTVVESKDGLMFIEIVDSTVDPGNLGFDKTVNQILSTFEFIE